LTKAKFLGLSMLFVVLNVTYSRERNLENNNTLTTQPEKRTGKKVSIYFFFLFFPLVDINCNEFVQILFLLLVMA